MLTALWWAMQSTVRHQKSRDFEGEKKDKSCKKENYIIHKKNPHWTDSQWKDLLIVLVRESRTQRSLALHQFAKAAVKNTSGHNSVIHCSRTECKITVTTLQVSSSDRRCFAQQEFSACCSDLTRYQAYQSISKCQPAKGSRRKVDLAIASWLMRGFSGKAWS